MTDLSATDGEQPQRASDSGVARAVTERRYTSVAIILHWVIAAAIAFQLVGGKWMVSAGAAATGSVFAVFQIHKTVGLTILALTLARIIWRLAHPAPALPAGMAGWERAAAATTHIGFYALLILIPLSGWAMASVSPTGVPTFFLMLEALPFAHLPLLAEAGLTDRHNAEAFLKAVHENLSLAMGLLIALHIAAALKHQFIAKDHLLARMIVSARTLPNALARPAVGGIALVAALTFLIGGITWGIGQKTGSSVVATPNVASTDLASNEAETGTANWVIDHTRSTLGFTITFTGNPVTATIGAWQADIRFDPEDLAAASATVTIDMTSVVLNDTTLQAQASGGDGFDLTNHPTATFEASAFSSTGESAFAADGRLTLRGATADVPLTFTFQEDEGEARVTGSATLNRLDFGIGAVGAADEAWIRYPVEVTFDLVADRLSP